jgi:hypothetical protein
MAGGRRQAHAFGKGGGGESAVALERDEDLVVKIVELSGRICRPGALSASK